MTFTRMLRRRVMIALYAAMALPLIGWAFVDLATRAPHLAPNVRLVLAGLLTVSIVVLGALLVWVDRTVIKPLEERAMQFAACLSHELRTPLTGIHGAAELLADETIDDEARRRFARTIVVESERLERLVKGILDLERQEHGADADPFCADVGEELDVFADRVAPLLERKRLHLAVASEPGLVARMSSDRLQRVLMGLVENAIRHSPKDGTVRIDAKRVGERAHLFVDDEGPGVKVEDRERIFSRRYSTDRGYGLGLAIVAALLRGAGATVRAESAPSGGARFAIDAPTDSAYPVYSEAVSCVHGRRDRERRNRRRDTRIRRAGADPTTIAEA